MVVGAVLLMACGAGGTYIYMKRDKTPEQTTMTSSAISGQKQQSLSVAPEIKTEQLQPAIVVIPAQHQTFSEGERKKNEPPSSLEKSAPAIVKRPGVAAPPVLTPQRNPPSTTPQKTTTVPALRVNGIALQDDGSASVAMINGEPLSRGGIIAGVTVEEIYINRVKFNFKGTIFEVALGQSNQ
jgi:hypothetical protein